MTQPSSQLVPPGADGHRRRIQRRVGRAFLFGGRSLHRHILDAEYSRLAADTERLRVVLAADTERLRVVRGRLSDLSWLMRRLAESIARRANRENRRKARFRQGRFKVQTLCNECALRAAMTYVDPDPLHARTAQGLEDSGHTRAIARMTRAEQTPHTAGEPLGPIMGVLQPPLAVATADHLQLPDGTGRFGQR